MLRKSISILCVLTAGIFSSAQKGVAKELVFKWGKAEHSSDTFAELKERAIFALLQENIRNKIEKTLLDLKVPYTLKLEDKILPSQFSIRFEDQDSETLEELKTLSESNVSSFLEEFDLIKSAWLDWTQKQKSSNPTPSYVEFLDSLASILEDISLTDLIDRVQSKLHSKNQELETFLDLPLTETHQEMITSFITDFANKNMVQLIADRKSMEERKESLAVIHPLRHIGFLWSNPNLIESVKLIKKADFKWTRFIKGMGRALKRHKLAGTLNEYIPGFAASVKADKDMIQTYLNREDYKGMFDYLLQL